MRRALVGRDDELAVLDGALARAEHGRGDVVLVTGPAGIGKTRLCDELYTHARQRSVPAAWAVCWESVPSLALAPWLDLLGQLGRRVDVSSSSDDPVLARAVGLDRIVSVLGEAANSGPLLLVIDDVQWADLASFELLGRAVGLLPRLPVLLVAAARTNLAGGFDLSQLDELERRCDTLHLRPLGHDAIASVAVATAGGALDAAGRDDVVERAAGNPLFARELAALVSTTDPAERAAWLAAETRGVPHALRSLLLRPLDDLSSDARLVVAAVALAGDMATTDVISSATPHLRAGEVLRRLSEAERAGVLIVPDGGPPRLHHPLLRAAIVDALDPVERATLHRRIGHALADRADRDPAALVAMADHLLSAAAVGDHADAVLAARRAAAVSMRNASYEQAAALLHRAVVLLDGDAAAADRVDVVLALGEAMWATGDADGGRRRVLEAGRLARDAGRVDAVARAALALGGPGGFEVQLFDRDQIDLLQTARRELGEGGDPVLRSWVEARLSVALSLTAPEAERAVLADRSVELARASADAAALAHALAAWCDVNAGPDSVAARAVAATEIIELSAQVHDPAVELLGRRLRVVAHLEAGDLAGADADIEEFARLAAPLGDPRFDWVVALWRGMRALHDGRIDDFLAWNDRVATLGRRAGSGGAEILAIGQRWLGLIEIGRDDEASALWAANRPDEQYAGLGPMMAATTAFAAAVAGEADRAERLLDRFDLAGVPKDSEWLSTLSQLADAIARTGHRHLAGPVRDALAPYAGLWVIDGIGGVIRGPVEHWVDELTELLDEQAPGRATREPANRFSRQGDVWLVALGGVEAHVRDSKGMRDLAVLLGRPGQDVAALDLMAGGTETVVQAETGPVLDATARAAYRARLGQLRVELDAADAAGDAARSGRAQAEFDILTDELRRATGLAGRARRQGGTAQRARTAVTGRIRSAIERIDAVHPPLGSHLRASIRTGAVCAYDPREPVDWTL